MYYTKPRRTHWSENWIPLASLRVTRGWLPEIGYCPTEKSAYKWCVQFGGNGHYFRSAEGAVAYAQGRGWLASTLDAERLVDDLEAECKACDEEAAADGV